MTDAGASFSIGSLNCAPMVSAAALCAELGSLATDVLCLQNCTSSKLKNLPDEWTTASMGGCAIAYRKGVFEVKQQLLVNVMEEVLRRTNCILPYQDALTCSHVCLHGTTVPAFFALLQHKASGHSVIVVNGDVTVPHRITPGGEGNSTEADSAALHFALSTEIQRVLWRTHRPGLCEVWNCQRVIIAGGFAGYVNSPAYVMLNNAAATDLNKRVDLIAATKPVTTSIGASEEERCTSTFVLTATADSLDGDVMEANIMEVDLPVLAQPFLEVSTRTAVDGMSVGDSGVPVFSPVLLHPQAIGSPDGDRTQWRLVEPIVFSTWVSSLFRLSWTRVRTSTESETSPHVALLARRSNVIVSHGSPALDDPTEGVADRPRLPRAAPMRSALSCALSPDEVLADIEDLRRAYREDRVAADSFARQLALRSRGGRSPEACGEPVSTVSDFSLAIRSSGIPQASEDVFRTGCRNFIFFTCENGLHLVKAHKLRASELLKSTSTIHKLIACTFALTPE